MIPFHVKQDGRECAKGDQLPPAFHVKQTHLSTDACGQAVDNSVDNHEARSRTSRRLACQDQLRLDGRAHVPTGGMTR